MQQSLAVGALLLAWILECSPHRAKGTLKSTCSSITACGGQCRVSSLSSSWRYGAAEKTRVPTSGTGEGALRIICRSGGRSDQPEPIRHRLCCNASAQYRQPPHSRNQKCSGVGIRCGYILNRESATERTSYRGLWITSLGCATEQPELSIRLCHRAPWVCYRANQLQRSRGAAILRITSRHMTPGMVIDKRRHQTSTSAC